MWMKLSEIGIPKVFKDSVPKEKKMEKCRLHWNTFKAQDRPLVVNTDKILIDGYIQYLVLKENDVPDAKVIVSDKRKKKYARMKCLRLKQSYKTTTTTYVYGKHVGNMDGKEYVWRVPGCWSGWEELHKVGDTIIVNTKYGRKNVEITRVESHDTCPVDFKVKTVCRNRLGGK